MEVRTYNKNGQQAAADDAIKKTSTGSKKKLVSDKKSSKKSLKSGGKSSSRVLDKANTKDALDEILQNNQQFVPESSAAQDVENMLKAMDPHLMAKDKANKEINFLFDPRFYEGQVHYSRDGNTVFYTQDNEKKRAALKTNSMVEESINSVVDLYKFERDGTLTKAEYIKVHTCIARILRQDLKDALLQRLVEEDWKHDSKGKEYMEKKEVYDSLFELGDVWSPDIDAYQYVAFYEKVYKLLRGEEELNNLPKTKTCLTAN